MLTLQNADSGEPVFLPFRMSCFVFSNLIVTAGMLTPGLGTVGTVGWQIANQSMNVAINNANSNKSSPMTYMDLFKSYCVAVSASCSVALGLNATVPRLKVSESARNVLKRLVPFACGKGHLCEGDVEVGLEDLEEALGEEPL